MSTSEPGHDEPHQPPPQGYPPPSYRPHGYPPPQYPPHGYPPPPQYPPHGYPPPQYPPQGYPPPPQDDPPPSYRPRRPPGPPTGKRRGRRVLLVVAGAAAFFVVMGVIGALASSKSGHPTASSSTPAAAAAAPTTTAPPAPPVPSPNGTYTGSCDYTLGADPNSQSYLVGEVDVTNTGNVGTIVRVRITWPQEGYVPITARQTVRVAAGATDPVRFHVPAGSIASGSNVISLLQSWQSSHSGNGCTYNATITGTYGQPR